MMAVNDFAGDAISLCFHFSAARRGRLRWARDDVFCFEEGEALKDQK